MLVFQDLSVKGSSDEISLHDFLNASTPFIFDEYKCSNKLGLEMIQPFILKKIYCKERIDDHSIFTEIKTNESGYFVYERIKSVKVGFEYFWNEYLTVSERPFIFHLLSLIPGSIYEKNITNAEIVFHSHFGNSFQNYDPSKKYIFFSGEKYNFPIEPYTLSLSYKPDSENSVCYPFFFTVMHTYQPRYNSIFESQKNSIVPNEFCAFIVSNPNCQIRNLFFQFVSQSYKQVKSYGKFMNNVGSVLDFPYNDERQIQILKKHKFVICFENTKLDDYYITEKILIAKAAGCVPIYWGSKRCLELFHPNSFLYLDDESKEGFSKLLKKIILLDQSNDLYLLYRNTPLINNENRMRFEKISLQNKIQSILFPIKKTHPYLIDCPKFFYINLDRSSDRKVKMEQMFDSYGISSYERVEAVDGNQIVHLEPRLSVYEEATTISHLKAVEQFYHSNLESAIICEDDLSLEWIDLWKKSLRQIIQDAPSDCEILQLAYTLYPHNFHHISQEYNPFLLVTFNGAMAYYITRKAAEKILMQHTWHNPQLHLYQKIRPVSDVLIYDLAKTYTYKYCLFTYPDDNKSTIHDNHLIIHINSKICARNIFNKL